MAKLTQKDVNHIAYMLGAGARVKDIAVDYRVSENQIRRVQQGLVRPKK